MRQVQGWAYFTRMPHYPLISLLWHMLLTQWGLNMEKYASSHSLYCNDMDFLFDFLSPSGVSGIVDKWIIVNSMICARTVNGPKLCLLSGIKNVYLQLSGGVLQWYLLYNESMRVIFMGNYRSFIGEKWKWLHAGVGLFREINIFLSLYIGAGWAPRNNCC